MLAKGGSNLASSGHGGGQLVVDEEAGMLWWLGRRPAIGIVQSVQSTKLDQGVAGGRLGSAVGDGEGSRPSYSIKTARSSSIQAWFADKSRNIDYPSRTGRISSMGLSRAVAMYRSVPRRRRYFPSLDVFRAFAFSLHSTLRCRSRARGGCHSAAPSPTLVPQSPRPIPQSRRLDTSVPKV
jgi:hypothetical protein